MGFVYKKMLDVTDMVKRRLNAAEVADSDAYPENPTVNELVFDQTLNALVSWTGEEWKTVCTRAGHGG